MDTEVAVEGTARASGPTYVVNVEGIDHDWPIPTITAADIRESGRVRRHGSGNRGRPEGQLGADADRGRGSRHQTRHGLRQEDQVQAGIHELITAAADPAHPGHADTVAEFGAPSAAMLILAPSVRPALTSARSMRSSPLRSRPPIARSRGPRGGPGRRLPGPFGQFVSAVRHSASRRELRRFLDAGRLDEPVLVDAGTAARMARPRNAPGDLPWPQLARRPSRALVAAGGTYATQVS